ncbi:protein SODIUM POTASSIUM ROOT DEFECTIVE 1-like [Juglans microcarpa x Juglans regia]|uniref:protein SODIUM POTASSIUM ROOT DEFECTIVE 1-like n=1 Tax=Juglans microcarpa x Juglans regia TaxID=2249226 RepID=UPI001B7DBBE3|nr:protein SODIUM POTASSIUM ROOT DEFECTIVE 1-like [Juglans microcarpa x Juglans regia]
MKGIDIFCASQASTDICLSMEQASCSSSSSTIQLGGRAIDRHNPIIRDSRRSSPKPLSTAPCSSHPPINPKPYRKSKKGSSSSSKPNSHHKKSSTTKTICTDQKKKSVATPAEDQIINKNSSQATEIIRKIWAKQDDLITTPASSRYLLSDTAYFDGLSDYDPVLALAPVDDEKNKKKITQSTKEDESAASKPSSSSSPKSPSSDQVVVLRVSLHCKGCEGKLRKHLSRMEGVTSFNIDFKAKKVTIMGDVTPLGVLASVSMVKHAQFWPATVSSPSLAPANGSSHLEIKK